MEEVRRLVKFLEESLQILSLNDNGKVAILFIEKDGWEDYMKKYKSVLEYNGLVQFTYLPLSFETFKKHYRGV